MTTTTHLGILDTIQESLGFIYGVVEAGAEKAERILWRRVAPALGFSIVLAWFLTSYGGNGGLILSMLLGFVGYFSLWFFVLKARNITLLAFIGATYYALTFNGPVRGAKESVQTLLSLTARIGLYYLFLNLVLWTWPFQNNPGSFWIIFAAVIILSSIPGPPKLRIWIMGGYTATVLILALISTLGVYSGRAFDPTTAAPLHMVDPTTGQMDSLSRSPADCTAAPCFSALTGATLVPMNAEQAMSRSPQGWVALAAEEAEQAKAAGQAGTDIPWALIGVIVGGLVLLTILSRFVGVGVVGGPIASMVKFIIGLLIALGLIWLVVTALKAIDFWPEVKAAEVECPTEPQNLHIGSIIRVPVNCNVDTDAYMIRDGNFELEFADKSLPIVNGQRLLKGKSFEEFVSTKYAYVGREGFGMRIFTVDPSAFEEAGVQFIKLRVLEKGATARAEVTEAAVAKNVTALIGAGAQ